MVWRYKNATCELDLFFYLDLRSNRLRTLIRLTPRHTIGSLAAENEMPPCPPLSCPARICPFRVHCPSSNASFLTIRLALLTLKPSAGATGSSALST
jgi:hypothetical protein